MWAGSSGLAAYTCFVPALGVNIDHVATLREARYRGQGGTGEPDPLYAMFEACAGGADVITFHLREDRRHILDRDAELIVRASPVPVNLEMAPTEEMLTLATRLRPAMTTLVPEARREVTTEGGLDVRGGGVRLRESVRRLHDAGIVVSAFIDPDPAQVEAAGEAGFDVCEVHTGAYAHRAREGLESPHTREQLRRIAAAGLRICAAGLRFNAGHGLNYANVGPVAALPGLNELHIGHAIVSRAVVVGLREAVRQMRDAIAQARPHPPAATS